MNNCVCIKKRLARKSQFDLLLNCEIVQDAFVLYWSSFMYQSKISQFQLLMSTYGAFNLAGSHQDTHLIAMGKSSPDPWWQSALSALLTLLKKGPCAVPGMTVTAEQACAEAVGRSITNALLPVSQLTGADIKQLRVLKQSHVSIDPRGLYSVPLLSEAAAAHCSDFDRKCPC